MTYTERQVTNAIDDLDAYRAPLPSESRTFELTGLPALSGRQRHTLIDVSTAGESAAGIPYEARPTADVLQRRLIEHIRTRYRPDDFGAAEADALLLLPLGVAESLALAGETYRLALTPSLVAHVFGDRITDAMLGDDGRYVHSEGDGNWARV